ncbi:hypothetical protein AGRO_3120 [Agrobacterium sp. ATCC 31749]|nr:hypothetical protein AGRO_3120 [Agrobacterium sp. ATCC 31749]
MGKRRGSLGRRNSNIQAASIFDPFGYIWALAERRAEDM